ncbi:MAG: tRNA uridine-5-carboxymethylaminomethyl(34) synthesis GTPase MnmE [Pseudolabrys sp.]
MADARHPTIFALSSGRGPAAIAVVRISGPRAGEALKALGVKIPEPRKAGLARVRDPVSGEMIDEALALWFPGPNSETGEDVAELQLHGGHAVVAATLAALGRIEGLRPAEAGEFTRRAFENGKLDLTAVEGLADLVMAETEGQRRQALRQMKGALGGRAEAWRGRLIEALALVEAGIDFSDEADVPEDLLAPALTIVRGLEGEIAAALADGHRGERLRDGLTVAIAGPPNAGKSTLLNRLARREAAIVSPYAGTTRDVIEVHLDLGGLPVTLLDTAGIRETDDPVELEGVRRAQARAAAADLVLWVVDARETGPVAEPGSGGRGAPGDAMAGRGVTDGPLADPSAEGEAAASSAASVSGPRPGAMAGPPRADASPGAAASGTVADRAGISRAETARGGTTAASGGAEGGAAGDLGTVARSTAAGRSTGGPAASTGAPMPRAAGGEPSPGVHMTIAADESRAGCGPPLWLLRNKIDLIEQRVMKERGRIQNNKSYEGLSTPTKPLKSMVNSELTGKNELLFGKYEQEFDVSAASGAGFEALFVALTGFADAFMAGAESALVTRLRHRQALEASLAALRRALAAPAASREDLLAEELRLAAHALARLTGRVDVEDILDVIFRDFCIGK